ncbi:M50 family metallopeptidase [Pontibacillus halophilus]|uniref:M50 family metallopeptidase n=1 Tax=Pontibacillus halophilus TaxID=516704 RepID=UPI0003F59CD3|nr:M50 family metallopeptidase [Pontibacillus halophilus]
MSNITFINVLVVTIIAKIVVHYIERYTNITIGTKLLQYLSNFNTLFHELGHALVALLLGNRTSRIELYSNSEGVAISHTMSGIRGWIPRIIVSLAGYPFSSFIAFISIYLVSSGHVVILLFSYLIIVLLSLLVWIRNIYGAFWSLSFIAMFSALIYYQDHLWINTVITALVTFLFLESITTALGILRMSLRTPKEAGDTSSLASYTKIPAPFWGVLFSIQALYFAYQSIQLVNL